MNKPERPEPAPSYFAHVDGLRALAVVAVMVFHLCGRLLPGGFVGVDVFFTISGFVVTASLAQHRQETAAAFLARFYARRLARLMPALVTMLLATTLLYVMFVPRAWFNRAAESVGQWAFWGLSNWNLDRHVVNYFEPRAELNPFTHTWSLGVEEQFYLVVPLLLFFALGLRVGTRQRSGVLLLIGGLALMSLVLTFYVGLTRGPRHVFYLLGYRFWELAAGVLLYLAGSRVGRLPAAQGSAYRHLSAPAGLALIALAMVWPKPEAYPYVRSVVAVAGAVLAIGLPDIPRPGRVPLALAHPLALWVGHRSYALYLWHWPVYVLARWTTGLEPWPYSLIGVALSIALAALSYSYIEKPIRYNRVLIGWTPALRLGVFIGVVAAAWGAAAWLQDNQPRLSLTETARRPADWYADHQLLADELASRRPCAVTTRREALGAHADAITDFLTDGCRARQAGLPALFAVGDSHTSAYLPMLEQIAAEQGRAVTVLSVPGCAYVDMLAPMSRSRDPTCHEVAGEINTELLRRAQPGDIVLLSSLRVPRLVAQGGKVRPATADGRYELSVAEQDDVRLAAADARGWIRPLTDAGLKVIFELPKPIFRAHPFQCVDWFNHRHPDCATGLSEPRAAQERYRAPVVEAMREIAREDGAVLAWDPMPLLCEGADCTALHAGRPLYFDADHVSPYGNLVLHRHFVEVLARVAADPPTETQ